MVTPVQQKPPQPYNGPIHSKSKGPKGPFLFSGKVLDKKTSIPTFRMSERREIERRLMSVDRCGFKDAPNDWSYKP
jgi:hypothetical protein